MKRVQFKILLLMLCLAAGAASAQVPTPDEIWGRITGAAYADILSYRIALRDINQKTISDSISSQINELQSVFDRRYSTQDIDVSLTAVERLISNPAINDSQASAAELLYKKLIAYKAVAKDLYSLLILDPGNIAFRDTRRILNQDEVGPALVTIMSEEIKAAFENNGLFKMPIDKDYKYLNEKRNLVKTNLDSLINSESGAANQMIEQLRATLNTVNDISSEFPNVEIILDQFKNDK